MAGHPVLEMEQDETTVTDYDQVMTQNSRQSSGKAIDDNYIQ